ncbi:hypothetical protein NO136_20080, partial [Clostridioides difficile]|nr:hypothetical protein [Clostridioides difficile]
ECVHGKVVPLQRVADRRRGDRAPGTGSLDCGASGSTTPVVGMVGGCGMDACAICIDASEAGAIGVGA